MLADLFVCSFHETMADHIRGFEDLGQDRLGAKL